MAEKYLFKRYIPPKLEGYKKEKLLKAVEDEITEIPKLKKAITSVRYSRNWGYLYHKSRIEGGKNEMLYRIAVYDDDYNECVL